MTTVVHLSTVHRVRDTRILYKEARTLADAGFDVCVIARGDEDATELGIHISVLNWRFGNRLMRMLLAPVEGFVKTIRQRPHIVHIHDPELLPVALVFRVLGKRVVYDAHENLRKQIASKHWVPERVRPLLARAASTVEHVLARGLNGVVAATPGIAETFTGNNVVLVRNFAIAAEFGTISGRRYQDRPGDAVYVGSVSQSRGIEQMVDAIGRANEECAVTLEIGGVFDSGALRAKVMHRDGWQHIRELGWLTRDEVMAALARNRVGLLLLQPAPNYLDAYPVKLFEYMLAALPVVASDFPFWRQFVQDEQSGLMVDPKDPEAIANALCWLLEHPQEAEEMGKRGRAAALARYSWEAEGARLVNFYRSTLGAG